jgi:hypothetical protein
MVSVAATDRDADAAGIDHKKVNGKWLMVNGR